MFVPVVSIDGSRMVKFCYCGWVAGIGDGASHMTFVRCLLRTVKVKIVRMFRMFKEL